MSKKRFFNERQLWTQLIIWSFLFRALFSLQTTKAFLPAMLEKDHGHIVTIASLAGHVGIAKLVDYCSSKFAAVGFDEALRLELEILGSNVQTTCVCPFFIQATGMFEDVNSRWECSAPASYWNDRFFNAAFRNDFCRWVPTLTSEQVADRIVTAIQKKEKIAVIPRYLQFMLCIKW